MFNTLIETRPRRDRSWSGYAASTLLHAVAIGGAVFATHQVVEATAPVTHEQIVFLAPHAAPTPPAAAPPPTAVPVAPPPPKGFQVLVAPVDIPTVLPTIDLARQVTNAADFTARGAPGGTVDGVVGAPPRPITTATAYASYEVDKQAALLAGGPTPVYPELLRNAGIDGTVRVSFVIGTDGRAEMSTLTIVESTHRLFADAVKAALSRMRFLPAEVGSSKVRQLVEMPFHFYFKP